MRGNPFLLTYIMKKTLFSVLTLAAGLFVASCSNDDDNTLATAPVVATVDTVDFEAPAFAALVDTPEYNGPKIYSALPYTWQDALTGLSATVEKDDWTAFNMGYGWLRGFAISNYVDNDPLLTYDRQLTIPQTNGSRRFAVCYADSSRLVFADGRARRATSIDISPTTYQLNDMLAHAQAGYEMNAILTFIGTDTTRVEVPLAKDETVEKAWKTIRLESVPAWKTMVVTFEGTDASAWGLNTPKYLAVDNICVVRE